MPIALIVALLWFFVLLLARQAAPPLTLNPDADTRRDVSPLPTHEPRPLSYAVTENGGAALQYFFLYAIPQGETRLARVVGSDIKRVIGSWLGMMIDFYPVDDGSFYGLLDVGVDQPESLTNPLDIYVMFNNGSRTTLSANVQVLSGGYVSQSITLDATQSALLDPETEQHELAMLHGLTSGFTLRRMWDGVGFQLPIEGTLTSSFGALRTLNGVVQSRHTGWDFDGRFDAPIHAAASGQVVYTGRLDIRGNYVLIDHGFGVYTGYAHLNRISVETGQRVAQGDVIGTLGSTGRTTSPNFHWEVSVNGEWVNPIQFFEMWQP